MLSESATGPIDLSDTSCKVRKWDFTVAYAESKLDNVLFAKVYIYIHMCVYMYINIYIYIYIYIYI